MEGKERGSRLSGSVTWVVLYSMGPAWQALLGWAIAICKSLPALAQALRRHQRQTRQLPDHWSTAQHRAHQPVHCTCDVRAPPDNGTQLPLALASVLSLWGERAQERPKSLFRSAGRRERAAGAGREGEALAPLPAADADGPTSRRRRSSPRTPSRARPGGLRRALRRPARLGFRVPRFDSAYFGLRLGSFLMVGCARGACACRDWRRVRQRWAGILHRDAWGVVRLQRLLHVWLVSLN